MTWWTIYRPAVFRLCGRDVPGRVPVGAILANTAHEAWRRARAPLPFCAYTYRPGPPDVDVTPTHPDRAEVVV